MPALDLLKLPARRDVKGLGTVLSEIEPPTPMKATFVEDRYGTFVVVGDVVRSESSRTLTLAGRFIEQSMKPDRTLRLLVPVTPDSLAADAAADSASGDAAATDSPHALVGADSAGSAELATGSVVVPASDTNELRATVAALHHGDLVRAGFHVRAYGSFTITGMAVWSDVAGAFLVGGWYVSSAQEQPASRLESLTVLATADEHGAPVPPRITGTLGEDDLGA